MKVKVFDNGGKTADRYTVILNREGDYVAMSAYPFDPQGFGQHGEGCQPGKHLGKRIQFDDLPEDCKKLVRRDLLDQVKGVAIVNEAGDIVRVSKNLAGILVHARQFRLASEKVMLTQFGHTLTVTYPNGDHCRTDFRDPSVLSQWIAKRVHYGRGKFGTNQEQG